jgi:membrane fusion protein, multidrug efflux system
MRGATLALLSLVWLAACDNAGSKAPAPHPVDVVVYEVKTADVPVNTEVPGRVTASAVAEIRPQVGGILLKRTFVEGGEVKAGQVLYVIDPASARAQLASAQAALASARATLVTSRENATRYADLVKIEAVSAQSAEEAQSAFETAQANVATAAASLESAQLALGYTEVKAPISGRIGRSTVTQGALLTADQTTALATVQQLDPVYVDATYSAAQILRFRRERAAGRITLDSQSRPRALLTLDDGHAYEHAGEVLLAETIVDESTGTVALRAQFPNPEGFLLPGMYVRMTMQGAVSKDTLVVPQSAVSRNAKGNAVVMIVGKDNKVEERTIVAGQATGNQWIVESGLAIGDRVIVEGLQKVRAGSPVKVVAPR